MSAPRHTIKERIVTLEPLSITLPQVLLTLGLALIAAIAPTIMALSALKQVKTSTEKTLGAVNASVAKTTAIDEKTDVLVQKVEEVHLVTNSNLARVRTALEASLERVQSLETLVTKLASPASDAAKAGAEATAIAVKKETS